MASVKNSTRLPARLNSIGMQFGSVAACVLLWHLASTLRIDLGIITFSNVPTPQAVISAIWQLLQSNTLLPHLGSSLARVFSGYLMAAVAGVSLGLAIGRSRKIENWLMPPLELLRPIPAVAWIPLAILMFPSSEASMIFITFTGALFPILLNTIHGVEAVDPRLVASSRSLGASPRAILREVVLPGALPSIFTGLSIGMGTSWFCLVTAEMISGQWGIGYYTWSSYVIQNYADIIVGMLLIGLLGMGSSWLIKRIGDWLTPWYRLQGKS